MTATPPKSPQDLHAFVIMPFEPEFQPIYDDLIRPPLEETGFEVARADSLLDQQNILSDIVQGIANADLVVAEITTPNPNVLYELGLAHALGIPTVMLAQGMDQVPFDLRAYRVLTYSTHFAQTHELIDSLRQIAEKLRDGDITFSSPVSDFLPKDFEPPEDEGPSGGGPRPRPRGPSGPPTPRGPLETPGDAEPPVDYQEEPGWLDIVVESEDAIGRIGEIFAEMAASTEDIATKVQTHAAQISSVAESGGPGAAKRVQQISLRVAADIDAYATGLESRQAELDSNIGVLFEWLGGYRKWISVETAEERQQVSELKVGLHTLLEGTRGGLEGVTAFRGSTSAAKGISRVIDRAAKRMATALDRVIESMERVESFCVRTIRVIDDKLAETPDNGGSDESITNGDSKQS